MRHVEKQGFFEEKQQEEELRKSEDLKRQRREEETMTMNILKGAAFGTIKEVIASDGSASYFKKRPDGSVEESPVLFLDAELRRKYLDQIDTMVNELEAAQSNEIPYCPRCGAPMVHEIAGNESRWICQHDMTELRDAV